MTYLRIILVLLFIQMTKVSTGGSPTHLKISLKLNIKHRNKDSQICTTAACNKTAEMLRKYVELELDPCKDFYQFTCGNGIKEMPPGRSHVGSFSDVMELLKKNVIGVLEEPHSEAKDNFEKLTKMSFQACIDTTAIEMGSIKALKKVSKKFGGWPLVEGDQWKEEECNLTMIFTEYNLQGMWPIFDVMTAKYPVIGPPAKPPTKFKTVDPYKENSTILNIYKQYVLNANLYLGEMEKNDNFVKAVDDIIVFGKSLSECQKDLEPILNETTMEVVKKIFEKVFDIESFLKSYYLSGGIALVPNQVVAAYEMPYFYCLAHLLEVTSKRTIVNYLIWNMIKSSSVAMPKQFAELTNTFQLEIGNPPIENITHLEMCYKVITDNLDKAVGHLYVMRHLPLSSKEKILDILERIKNSFKRLIANENWLTKEAKAEITSKVEQTKEHIGYPDYLYDPKFFYDDFNEVDFSGQSFLEMFLTTNTMKVKDSLKVLINPDAGLFPITFINGLHHEPTNTLIFTPGILLPPYYSESFPMYLNFGGIGQTMGHELTHAIGDTDNKVVLNGVTRDLWMGDTKEKFLKRIECVVKQSDGIPTSLNIKLNGSTTKSETIADAGGLRAAYGAYKGWLKEYGEEKQLPGFPYNSEQMFFISTGVNHCRRFINETWEYPPGHSHPPNRIRINTVMKNFKTFSKVFKCKANSEMNLSERCRVW